MNRTRKMAEISRLQTIKDYHKLADRQIH